MYALPALSLLALLAHQALALKHLEVRRTVDLSTSVVRDLTLASIENDEAAPVKEYVVIVSAEEDKHLSFIEVADKKSSRSFPLTKEAPKQGSDTVTYRFALPTALAQGDKLVVSINKVLSGLIKPYPEEIGQHDRQLLLYQGDAHFLSEYPTIKSKTTFKLPKPAVESYTTVTPTSLDASTLVYGPYKDLPSRSSASVSIHYENNLAILGIRSHRHELWISHWGANLAVEEHYDAYHAGARLRGHFSRIDYQRTMFHPDKPILRQLVVKVPEDANSVYYRDEVGNVSTSHWRPGHLELIPRYPIFGGWNTTWHHGYNVELGERLRFKDGRYYFRESFITPIEGAPFGKVVVRIVLPEGVQDIQVVTPFDVTVRRSSLLWYVDSFGRSVIEFEKDNLVDEHSQVFEISYKFPEFWYLHEPVLLSAFFFGIFTLFIISQRIDLSIGKDEKTEAQEAFKNAKYEVVSLQSRITNLLATVDNQVDANRSNPSTLRNIPASQDKELSPLIRQLESLVDDLNAGSKLGAKVKDAIKILQDRKKIQAARVNAIIDENRSEVEKNESLLKEKSHALSSAFSGFE